MVETVHRYFPFSKENFIVPNGPSMDSLCQLLLFESKGSINISRQLPNIGVEVKVGVVVLVKVGDGVMVGVLVGVLVLVYVGVVVGDRNGTELQLIEMRKKVDRPRKIAFNEMYLRIIIVDSREVDLLSAQRTWRSPAPSKLPQLHFYYRVNLRQRREETETGGMVFSPPVDASGAVPGWAAI